MLAPTCSSWLDAEEVAAARDGRWCGERQVAGTREGGAEQQAYGVETGVHPYGSDLTRAQDPTRPRRGVAETAVRWRQKLKL